ncbi:MAG: hypothetical protein OEY79_00045 [Anaplasmataceae bacterium]|nr:hypothetical protein [Anaplasmataceae bacterium]
MTKNNKIDTLIEIKRNRKLKYLFLSIKLIMTLLMGIEIIIGSSLPLLMNNHKKSLNHASDYVQAIMGLTVIVGFLMLTFAYYNGKRLSSLSSYARNCNIKKYNAIFPKNNNKNILKNQNNIKSIFIKFDKIIGSACFVSIVTFIGVLWDVIPAFGVLSSANLHSYFEKLFEVAHEPNITTKLSNFALLMFTFSSIGIILSIRGCYISCKEYSKESCYIKKISNNNEPYIIEDVDHEKRKKLREDYLNNKKFAITSSILSICFCCMMTGLLLAKGLVDKNIMIGNNMPLPTFLSIIRGIVFMSFGLTVIARNIIICNKENNFDQELHEIYIVSPLSQDSIVKTS